MDGLVEGAKYAARPEISLLAYSGNCKIVGDLGWKLARNKPHLMNNEGQIMGKERIVQKQYLEKAKVLIKSIWSLSSQPEISNELKELTFKIQT